VDLDFRPFDAASALPEQRDLFRDCFPEAVGSSVESQEHYRWKFHSIAASPPSREYGVWGGDPERLLGYYAALPYRYSVRGDVYACGMVCDVMTHSAARGQGIFTKIGRYATDDLRSCGLDFTSGYPIRPEVMPGHLKVGWQVAQQLPMYLKVLRCDAILRRSAARFLAPLVNLGLSTFAFVTRGRSAGGAGESVTVEPAGEFLDRTDGAYERLFARWAASRGVHLIKDRSFLAWRLGAPGTAYHIISARSGAEISALAIVRCTELKGISCLAVLDLMLPDGSERTAGPLMLAMERFAVAQRCEAIAAMMSRESARRASLARHGFIRTPFVFKLIVKPLSERAKQARLLEPSTFDVMWIDSDDL
jgi:hypothetical protein